NTLKHHECVYFHIGILNEEFLTELHGAMAYHGLASERFIYLGEVPNLPEALVQLEIDFYVPTLPQSGGKSVIDAMAAGIPVLAHQNARDRIWGSIDMIYPSALTWRTLNELDQIFNNVDESLWINQAKDSRDYFDRFHNELLFLSQLRQGGVDFGSEYIPDLKKYKPEIAYSLLYSGYRK
ncbi:MAG: hypothetical protein RIQ47_279, partial [Bacteroidota bacterium]